MLDDEDDDCNEEEEVAQQTAVAEVESDRIVCGSCYQRDVYSGSVVLEDSYFITSMLYCVAMDYK